MFIFTAGNCISDSELFTVCFDFPDSPITGFHLKGPNGKINNLFSKP